MRSAQMSMDSMNGLLMRQQRLIESMRGGNASPAGTKDEEIIPVEASIVPINDFEMISASDESKAESGKNEMTGQQLKVLGRKHLLMIIRDLEKELGQVKAEKEELLLAYKAGVVQNQQMNYLY